MGIKNILMMAQAMAILGDNFGFNDEPRYRPRKEPKPKLSGVKHIGPIPHGCKLVTATIQTRLPDFLVEMSVEIVAANNKSFNQKLVKKEHEVLAYIARTSVNDLMQDSRIKLTLIQHEQAVEDTRLEG